jgi:hypothetical protein
MKHAISLISLRHREMAKKGVGGRGVGGMHCYTKAENRYHAARKNEGVIMNLAI